MKSLSIILFLTTALHATDCAPSNLGPEETKAKFQELDREAQSAFDRGQYAAAAQHYREEGCLVPKSARAFYGLGASEAAEGNYPAAENAFVTASELLPDNAMPLAMLVRVDLAMHDISKVKERLRTLAARFPRDAELHSGLARFLAENQFLELALAESLRFEQTGVEDMESAITLAVLENTVGAYDDAIHHALPIESASSVPMQLKASAAGIVGLSYEKIARREEGVRHLKLAIELAPMQVSSYLALAFVYEKAQKFTDAVELLQQGRKQIPSETSLLLPLGNNLVWAEQFQAGVDVLNEIIGKAPDTTEAYIRLAEAYRKMGRPELEIQVLQRLARRKPTYPMIHVLIAQSMMRRDPVDYPQVLTELAQAEKSSPDDAEVCYLRGKIFMATNRYTEAVAALKRAIDLRPMEPSAYYQLGLTYRKLDQTALAREVFERMEFLKGSTKPFK